MKFTTPVIKGQGRGKSLGYPTLNLQIPKNFSLSPGIYASWVWLGKTKYQGALHYGPRPVFHDPEPSLEIFILNYSSTHPTCPPEATGSRNGRIGSLREAALRRRVTSITFEPIKYLRPIRNFSSPQALAHQISRDVAQIKKLLS